MTLNPTVTWHLELNANELGLLNKALRGNLAEEDLVPAKELSDQIAKAKIAYGVHMAKEIAKLEQNYNKERGPLTQTM